MEGEAPCHPAPLEDGFLSIANVLADGDCLFHCTQASWDHSSGTVVIEWAAHDLEGWLEPHAGHGGGIDELLRQADARQRVAAFTRDDGVEEVASRGIPG